MHSSSISPSLPEHNWNLTVPNIHKVEYSYIVNHLSQFLQTPIDIHWQAVKRVIQYISGTKHLSIYIQPSLNLNVVAYSDADWASNVDDRRSITTYCVFVRNNLVSLSSKKQNVVARLSTSTLSRLPVKWFC